MKSILKRASGLVLAAFLLTTTLPTLAYADFYARVVGVRYDDVLWVRNGPGTRYRKFAYFGPYDTNIRVSYCSGNWCYVSTRFGWGWSSGKFLQYQ